MVLLFRYEFPPFYDASDETFTLVVFRFRRQLEEEKEQEEKERCGPRVVVFSIVVIIISATTNNIIIIINNMSKDDYGERIQTALSDKNEVDVFVFIDCDNVRPRFSASDEEAAAQRFLHAFHRAASCYGDVVSLSLYGNEKTFGEEVKGDVKRGGEEDKGEEEGGWTRARTNERNTKKKSLGEALESVRILGSRVRVVRTRSGRKQSADIRCVRRKRTRRRRVNHHHHRKASPRVYRVERRRVVERSGVSVC